MPTCTIIPVLEYPDVPAAVKWLEEAFAFEVRLSIGAHRAQLQLRRRDRGFARNYKLLQLVLNSCDRRLGR